MRNAECGMRNAECGMRNLEIWVGKAQNLKFSTSDLPVLNDYVLLADWQRRQISNLVRRVRFSQGTLSKSEFGIWNGECGMRPIGPVWSGRHFVKVEITGSNPVWVAVDAESGAECGSVFRIPHSRLEILCGTPTA